VARISEFTSYTFIRNELKNLGWNIKNPNRDPLGEVYTQQECLDNPEIQIGLGRTKPEYVIKVREDVFWVIEAKPKHSDLDTAFEEAKDYAISINTNPGVNAFIISGVAGNEEDEYLIKTAVIHSTGRTERVTYNGKNITGLLSPSQARDLVDNSTGKLNDLKVNEVQLLKIAEEINEVFHGASINKDARATVISAILLSMVSDTLPNLNASPEVFIRDINNRAEDVLIAHSKREFAQQIELQLPHEESAKAKYKSAIVKVFFKLRKINIKAAMDSNDDILGKFYEVFLKYGNGAKDIGIVLTPRHITQFACEVLDIQSTDVVYDPTCGTGGFLVAAYDYVRKNSTSQQLEMFKKHRIFGVEQQTNVATLAIVNMIFRGDGKNHIINEDCFAIKLNRKVRNGELSAEYVREANERPPVNKVLMNPPFALKQDAEQEYVFVNHALEQTVEGGLLFAIVPISVMYSGSNELIWRKKLLEDNTLVSVINLPSDLFYPSASTETVAIILKKGIPHDMDKNVFWMKITDDGYKKLKRKRLPNSATNGELQEFKTLLNNFIIDDGNDVQILGRAQTKPINEKDTQFELIPQAYLENEPLENAAIIKEMKNVYQEIIFQNIREES
jgi:type I restriction-modification system DNA methylase subunit